MGEPDATLHVLLVDTYDTVDEVKTAIEVATDRDLDLAGVRLDSGDLTERSKRGTTTTGSPIVLIQAML